MTSTESTVRFISYPRTEPPATFAGDIASVFEEHESRIATRQRESGLKSDEVLDTLRGDLVDLGFEVESGKRRADKIHRPVLFGVNGEPELKYEVDAYHEDWRCGLEVEAGRAWKGNAVYLDIVQALVMVQIDTLVLAVPNVYKFKSGDRTVESKDFQNTKSVADTLFETHRFDSPYNLVLIGY